MHPGISNPVLIAGALVFFVSTLFIGNEIGLKLNFPSYRGNIGAIIGTGLFIGGGLLWRSFAGDFVVPVLPWQAQLAVLSMHYATGQFFGLWNGKRVRDAITKDVKKFMAENADKLPADQLSDKLLNIIKNAR